ncbi:MAG: 5-formyltetrahydrofolate cyclo-ligase [Bacteroidetes bacterium]|nr:MAG: 5-formyltetrahydrofolate cyclo-ligase [Bacteroidota bacterium]
MMITLLVFERFNYYNHMKKEEGRRIYKGKRKELSEAERVKANDLMLIQFQKVDLPEIHHLLSYWPIEENQEPNTSLFSGYLEFKYPSIKFLYPKADFQKNEMEAVEVDADTAFLKNAWNIHEPMDGTLTDAAVIDMVFVPLLIFDKRGYRIGYGQGFYDKYLQQCRPDCLKVGFCYFEPVDVIEGTHEFDVPLNLCITPNNVYVF